jgi:hypothetical protein
MAMRTIVLLLLCAFGWARPLQAQSTDVILHTDGRETSARVLSITPTLVTYQAGTDTLTLPTREVFLIRYPNGSRELLAAATKFSPAPVTTSEESLAAAKAMDRQGRIDAGRNFKIAGTFWGSYVTTIASTPTWFMAGAATSITLGSLRPLERNLIVPDPALRANPSYMAGYRSRAAKKKFGSAALGFAMGVTTVAVASFIMYNEQ